MQLKFINLYGDYMLRATQGINLFPSVALAQACLETGYGKSTIADAKNLYGIKAIGKHTPYWDGDYVEASTREVINGKSVYIKAKFRKYKSYTDSIKDRNNLLLSLSRYRPVLEANTPEEQCRQLQKCGYATATNYADSLIWIINKYDLKKLDTQKKK